MGKHNIEYTIVIPTYNSESILRLLLEDILNQRDLYAPKSIIIVDDNSSDDTEYLPKIFQIEAIPIKYIRLEEQVGPLSAELTGIKNVQTPMFVSIHADCRFGIVDNPRSKHPIDKLVCYLYKARYERDIKIAGIAPWTLQLESPYLIKGGPRGLNHDGIPEPYQHGFIFASLAKMNRTRFEPVLSFDNYCYAMFMDAFVETGGFDKELSPYLFYHDDLFAKIRNNGWILFLTSDITIFHPEYKPKDNGSMAQLSVELFKKNGDYFSAKWKGHPIWEWNSRLRITDRREIPGFQNRGRR